MVKTPDVKGFNKYIVRNKYIVLACESLDKSNSNVNNKGYLRRKDKFDILKQLLNPLTFGVAKQNN